MSITDVSIAYAPEYVLFRFTCGHVGRDNEAPHPKARAFIRVAEIRTMPVADVAKPCPDCKKSAG